MDRAVIIQVTAFGVSEKGTGSRMSRHHVLGAYPAANYEIGEPLPLESRIVFRNFETQESGYFHLIAPFFDDFAMHHGGPGIRSINALVILTGADLVEAIGRASKNG